MKSSPLPQIALFCWFGAVLGAQTAPVAGNEPPDETVQLPTFEVSSAQDVGYQAANSVSATRTNTPIADLPFSITAFTPQFIEDTAPLDLYDIVKYAAGVTSAAREFNQGADSFNIRGFLQYPERNGFQELFGNNYVDPANIERVEVVKGPASLLYGQVAPGGTVNYITKVPQDASFVTFVTSGGSYDYFAESIDANAQIIPHHLLFRVNAAYRNGMEFENITNRNYSWVFSPELTWTPSKAVTLTLSYEVFNRYEHPAAVYPPNMDVATASSIVNAFKTGFPAPSAALTNAVGVDAAANNKDSADLGFSLPFPGLPKYFNYDNNTDWRRITQAYVNLESDIQLGEHWVSRTNVDWDYYNDAFNQTGIGDTFIAAPGSLVYTPGAGGAAGTWAVSPAWSAMTSAQQVAAEYAFAQQLATNPSAAYQTQSSTAGAAVGNPLVIPRRPRLQLYWGRDYDVEFDFAGVYHFWGVTVKPLVGFAYDENWNFQDIYLNTGTAASPYYQTWDVNPTSPSYFLNQNPAPILPSQYTTQTEALKQETSDQAAFGVLNLSLFQDRLYVIAGARYNQSEFDAGALGYHSHYTTPQAGVGYKITPNSMIYASFSEAYTYVGGGTEVVEIINNVPTEIGTGPLKPTISEGDEIGYKTDFFNGRISSTLSIYRINQYDGSQTYSTIYSTGTLSNVVQGVTTRSNGLEYELTYTPIDDLQLFASVTENDVRFIAEPAGDLLYLGAHPQYTAKTLGNLWSRYNFSLPALKGLWLGFGFNYVSSTNGNANNPFLKYPAYTIFNSAAGYAWKWNKTKLSLNLNFDNMANRYYQPTDQSIGLPRHLIASLKVAF